VTPIVQGNQGKDGLVGFVDAAADDLDRQGLDVPCFGTGQAEGPHRPAVLDRFADKIRPQETRCPRDRAAHRDVPPFRALWIPHRNTKKTPDFAPKTEKGRGSIF